MLLNWANSFSFVCLLSSWKHEQVIRFRWICMTKKDHHCFLIHVLSYLHLLFWAHNCDHTEKYDSMRCTRSTWIAVKMLRAQFIPLIDAILAIFERGCVVNAEWWHTFQAAWDIYAHKQGILKMHQFWKIWWKKIFLMHYAKIKCCKNHFSRQHYLKLC